MGLCEPYEDMDLMGAYVKVSGDMRAWEAQVSRLEAERNRKKQKANRGARTRRGRRR